MNSASVVCLFIAPTTCHYRRQAVELCRDYFFSVFEERDRERNVLKYGFSQWISPDCADLNSKNDNVSMRESYRRRRTISNEQYTVELIKYQRNTIACDSLVRSFAFFFLPHNFFSVSRRCEFSL